MHRCAATCCDNESYSILQVQNCVENCSSSLNEAQNYVQNEFVRIQVCIRTLCIFILLIVIINA